MPFQSWPVEREYDKSGNMVVYEKRSGWTSRPPFNDPFPYERETAKRLTYTGTLPRGNGADVFVTGIDRSNASYYLTYKRNATLTKFANDVHAAGLMNNLATAKDTYSMISSRAYQMLRAVNAAKRGNIKGFIKELSISPEYSTRRRKAREKERVSRLKSAGRRAGEFSHDVAGLWLEYNYGWAPLMDDMADGLEYLSAVTQRSFIKRAVSTYNTTGSKASGRTSCRITAVTRLQGYVSNDNPRENLQLTRFDFPQAVWETIPFSFVVDWFIPVNTFLIMSSPTWRHSVTGLIASEKCTVRSTYEGENGSASIEAIHFRRTLDPGLVPRVDYSFFSGASPMRAAHAVAMLWSGLKSIKP